MDSSKCEATKLGFNECSRTDTKLWKGRIAEYRLCEEHIHEIEECRKQSEYANKDEAWRKRPPWTRGFY